MGIVVSVCMLLGLLLLWPWPSPLTRGLQTHPIWTKTMTGGVMLAGAWNALWHGLRHLDAFWGIAALVSGLLMMATAGIVLRRKRQATAQDNARTGAVPASARREPLVLLLFAALLGCFLLYAVTLVRLNLGYSIIG